MSTSADGGEPQELPVLDPDSGTDRAWPDEAKILPDADLRDPEGKPSG